ncbi:MAG: phosphoribosylformylglycinamidine synthase subunit PurL [Acidobacteria bacterium]|nr:phosphoribosylformylglycinamidine synthase subunit PurL [Acidobacteriota bacterium]
MKTLEPITPDLLQQHGLSAQEYERIVAVLHREPNLTELGIFSVMWSEHCSYKSSKIHLRKLPTRGPQVLQGPGENAGVVDLGYGLAAVFKIESHNHPSFIEPYQGAATGVGGIIRDIFTMGARPIALMNSLHFGPLEKPRNRILMEGVVAGIAGYGNCIGIPTVGGEIYFAEVYSQNPIVNVFCLGVAKKDRIFYGRAHGVGNAVIYAGAKTGRDGIHGATMASAEFGEESQQKRPNVQVGDPFLEKLLLEACLEAMKTGAVVGIQDMGAAGLTCSTCEMGSRAGTGIEMDLAKVPQREERMTPYELMLSESQERMLLVADRGRERDVLGIFEKWGLDAVPIGRVTDDGVLRVCRGNRLEAEIPNRALVEEAPLYDRPARRPAYLDALPSGPLPSVPTTDDLQGIFQRLLSSGNLASRRWVFQQYDHMVRTNTLSLPGSDAAVVRIKGTPSALAMTLDGNPRYVYLDPREGTRIAVAESCRNLVCSGARPLAATNCLNFASPENPEVMWQFVQAVEGLAEACALFETPITGGNVSFYNETLGRGIYPTPVVGMIGLLEDERTCTTAGFKKPGDAVVLLGETREELGGSEYLAAIQKCLLGPAPRLDLERERAVQATCLEAIREGLVRSAHDCSEGGLAIALAECSLISGLGASLQLLESVRPDALLFGESQSRIVISTGQPERVLEIAGRQGVPGRILGQVRDSVFEIRDFIRMDVSAMKEIWEDGLAKYFRVS